MGKGSGEVGLSRCFVVPERSRPFPTVHFIMCGNIYGAPPPVGRTKCAHCAEGELLLFRPCVSLKYTYPTYPAKPAWAGNRRCGRIPGRFSVRPGRGCWKCRIRWQAGGFRPHQCCKMRLCCQLHRQAHEDRGKHLAGTAPGCRKIQNGHALCFGLGKIIIADFGNHKKVPSL